MLSQNARASLMSLFARSQLLTDPVELLVYETDAAMDQGTPDAVVFAQSQDDVIRLAEWANEYKAPIIARGAGTGLSGGAVAEQGGVILAFSRMHRIIEIDSKGRSATVEPGVINLALDEAVRRFGLYYPPDPASGRSATLGGNVAENAGGPHCFKYGVTTNYVCGLQFVLPGGKTMLSGGYACDYPEYDFTGIITGSEGTLALVTKIMTRLTRQPPGVMTMMAVFDSVESAGIAVSEVIAAGLVPATMEMMDQKIARIVEDYAHPGLPIDAGAVLIVEVDGYPASLQSQIAEISQLLKSCGGRDLRIAQSAEEREKIWFARKSAAGAMARLAPAYLLLDGTVPRSALAEALETTNQICNRYDLQVGYVFHAGDGNLHPFILTDPKNPAHLQRARQAGQEFMEAVVNLGGSITGEHGVGIEKRPYLGLMYTPAELSVMQDIKQVFDPENLLNPGKIFSEPIASEFSAPPTTPLPPYRFAPENLRQAAEGLAVLSRSREPVQIIGGGAMPPALTPGRVLSTENLRGVIAYAPQDLYLTAQAGTTLGEMRAFLEPKGWQLALHSPWSGATLGGLLASNLNAPLRIRYGGLRDQVLAMTVVFADGRSIHAGRSVVKNVAGYDVPKLLIGSQGTLGLIVDVTLKIVPLPRLRRSLLAPVNDLKQGLEWAQACLSLALVSTGIVLGRVRHPLALDDSPYMLVYSAEGLPEDVESELEGVRAKLSELGAPPPQEVEGQAAIDLWAHLLASASGQSLSLRVGFPPRELENSLIAWEARLQGSEWLADIASGLLYIASNPDGLGEAQVFVDELRKPALASGGYAVVLDGPPEWGGKLERWGYPPPTLELMKRLKSRWDPAGILNPGSFVV